MNTNEGENIKVYELAKELGIDSLSLVSKIKEMAIPVRSHMSELSPEDVKKIKQKLTESQTSSEDEKPKKKVAVRKRTSSSDSNESTLSASVKTVEKTTEKKVITRRQKSAATETVESQDTKKAPTKTTVIRRRTTTTGEVETVVKSEGSKELVSTSNVTRSASTELNQTLSNVEAKEQADQTAKNVEPTKTSEIQIVSEAQLETKSSESLNPEHENKGLGLNIPSLYSAKLQGKKVETKSVINVVQNDTKKRLPSGTQKTFNQKNKELPKTNFTKSEFTKSNIPVSHAPHSAKHLIEKHKDEIYKEQGYKKKSRFDRDELEVADVKLSDYRAKKELIFLPKKKKPPVGREILKTQITTPAAHKRKVKIDASISVGELAQRLGVKVGELIKKLISMGTMATINQVLDLDTATIIASEYGFEVENITFNEDSILNLSQEDAPEQLKPRPPIVTIMGHVDHGKTSLLDAIRQTNVAAGEAGGITQHIGAYTVLYNNKPITFIDTPGHEAFTAMRARGANVTDIVILVVAADDGVMPQTREALSHAKAAGVPIIVAVNKIDKPTANPDRVYKELAELDLLAEEWGGQTIYVKVSALKKTGLEDLLEALLLQAEVLELKANPDRAASGVVLEAKLDKTRGPVATVLVKNGTLNVGDIVVVGTHVGKVRALINDKGEQMKALPPAYAAEVLGLEGVPVAGDSFHAVKSEQDARKIAEHRKEQQKSAAQKPADTKVTLEKLFSKVQAGDLKELPVIIKTDVFGSAEAIKDSLLKIQSDKVKVKVIHTAAGSITESDVMLAYASNAIIIGFNVRPDTKALQLAESKGIEIKTYSIIYELIDDVKKAMAGLLEKKAVEKYLGRAEVRNVFNISKVGTVAGCFVVDGKMQRNATVRLLRDGRIIFTGKLNSLKRFKDDVREVQQGYECGLGIENYNDIKVGDIIEAFEIEMVAQSIDEPQEQQATQTKQNLGKKESIKSNET
jgi:translation initiation factor IF-2